MGKNQIDRRKSLMILATSPICLISSGYSRAAGKMKMYKSPACGCCGKWAGRMRAAGFTVEEAIEADMTSVKAKLGVPAPMQSCHTAEIDGYIVEGHAPVEAINRLLAERPKAAGLAAPGMPAGSPGMEMDETEVYTLYLFDNVSSREFGKWRGEKPV